MLHKKRIKRKRSCRRDPFSAVARTLLLFDGTAAAPSSAHAAARVPDFIPA